MMIKFLQVAIFIGACHASNAQFWDYSEVVKIGGTINTDAEESIPVFSNDSSVLYFVRTYDDDNKGGAFDQDIWKSEKDENGGYVDCERVKELNNKFNNAVIGIGSDGAKMYVLNAYDGKKDIVKGVAESDWKGSSWSTPTKIDIPGLDIEGDYYGFHVNENVIIISYAGAGTKGEEDLYVSTKNGDAWSPVSHMGSAINSAGFEISPFLSKSQDTLFFSSNGFGGQGEADIFYSVKQGSWTSWSAPINLGTKINSPKFDAYFSHSGSQAYWSSNRDSERSDIYMVDILPPPPLSTSCIASDATTYQGSDGSIDLTLVGGVAPFTIEWSNGSSSEDALGLMKGEYTATVTDAIGRVSTSSCVVDEPPMPIEPVDVIVYENLKFKHNFGYNKNKLSTSKGDLKKFIKEIEVQLKEGRERITINIVSSASHVPTKTFGSNENLAQKRAENIKYDLVAYFAKKDIYSGKVTVVVVSAGVAGPNYEDDSANRDKYMPYQFVSLETE
jgi:SprB repeat/WD40-like Beta Propeller Repeat